MITLNQQIYARELLLTMRDCLSENRETNWSKGITAALVELSPPSDAGFTKARSIYRTMVHGGKGFSEYFVWDEDENRRMNLNREIDRLRDELWTVFGNDE
jgi:hypothetical protein